MTLPRLTPAECAVFRAVMAGQDDAQIGTALGCSHWTVRAHKANIRAKLGGTGAGHGWWLLCARAYEQAQRRERVTA